MKTLNILNHLDLLKHNCNLAYAKLAAAAENKDISFVELSTLSSEYLDSLKNHCAFLNRRFNSMHVYEIVNQYYNLGSRITQVENTIKIYEKDCGPDTIAKLDELTFELNKRIKDRLDFLNKEWTHE